MALLRSWTNDTRTSDRSKLYGAVSTHSSCAARPNKPTFLSSSLPSSQNSTR